MIKIKKRKIIAFHQIHEKGLFGQLTDCVLLSKACYEKGMQPYFFVETKVSYQKGMSRNSMSYYFFQPNLTRNEISKSYSNVIKGNCVIIRNRYDVNEFWSGDPAKEISRTLTSISDGSKYFHRNLSLLPYVNRISKSFIKSDFKDRNILGLHYRGTDKQKTETNPIGYDQVLNLVIAEFNKGEYDRIFLATDERSFYEYMLTSCIGNHIFSRVKPKNDLSHYEILDNNYEKGLDAILDWILLSHCKLLIKTPSLLSAWCKVLNSELKIITIGKPYMGDFLDGRNDIYGYWPESILYMIE